MAAFTAWAPRCDRRSPSVPALSSGRTGASRVRRISPASISSFIAMIVTPVIASPARSAHWTGAAPRWRGSRDACTLMHPRDGRARMDPAVRGHHDEIGRERAQLRFRGRCAQTLGLEHRQPTRERQALHLGRGDGEATVAGAIGLADDAHYRVVALEERLEDGTRKTGRAHEDEAPAVGIWLVQMSRRRA